ncbi:MAG: hypothetical protein HY774_18740 [Acidobacteria bacterium]|nr:hypothetical protein [Acidobacteriota bacterium]
MSHSTPNTIREWTVDLIREHCAGAARLELWTIPLYLSVAYSIQVMPDPTTGRPELKAVNYPILPGGLPDFEWFQGKPEQTAQFAFNSIMSIAFQEMLHIELAANLCNAIGARVDFIGEDGRFFPKYDPDSVPYIAVPSELRDQVRLAPLSLDSIGLLTWIEHYLPRVPSPPLSTQPRDQYRSIGEFYHALQHGVDVMWEDLYPQQGSPTVTDLKQKDDFQTVLHRRRRDWILEDYQFSVTISGNSHQARKRADSLIQAIICQGEGATEGNHLQVNPAYQLKHGDATEIALDRWTHWERFSQIEEILKVARIETFPVRPESEAGPELESLQQQLNQTLTSFLETLTANFSTAESLNLDPMGSLGSLIYQVWKAGGVPELKYCPGSK